MGASDIIVVDQTIREGMQYRGLMFSVDERKRILEFQEALGVDISQVAYPSAFKSERDILELLNADAAGKGYKIKVAGLGRVLLEDVDQMIGAGITDIHLHMALPNRKYLKTTFGGVNEVVQYVRDRVKTACIRLSVLDIGKIDPSLLNRVAGILINDIRVDTLTLPDTSGIMSPNIFYKRVQDIATLAKQSGTRIGVHCHNDMGMASANTVMGAVAGATVIEATALGMGERNGLGDIFLVGKLLKDQGYDLKLRVEDTDGFRRYYEFVNRLCFEKTGSPILNYETPFFGESINTHVAGTHGKTAYGPGSGEKWYLNVLCGKHLVKKYLAANQIQYREDLLADIVNGIKAKSVEAGRSVTRDEVVKMIRFMELDRP